MKPIFKKFVIAAGSMALWSSAAYADDHRGGSGDADRHMSARYNDDGHGQNGGRYRGYDEHSGHRDRYAYDDHGYNGHAAYRSWDHHDTRRGGEFYPVYPRYYSNYPRQHWGGSFGVSLGRNGYGHQRGHHGHH